MSAFDLFSIGHSNTAIERFAALLDSAGVTAVCDVRSNPVSRFCPWFSERRLAARLAEQSIGYAKFGDTLGGRPRDAGLYRDGIADYEAMARWPDYRNGLDSLLKLAGRRRVCLMCAERDPLDCHRCLLVARSLAERGVAIGHILHDGTVEPHGETEQRLLALSGEDGGLFAAGQSERLAAAYRQRARAVAYRAKPSGAKSAPRDPQRPE